MTCWNPYRLPCNYITAATLGEMDFSRDTGITCTQLLQRQVYGYMTTCWCSRENSVLFGPGHALWCPYSSLSIVIAPSFTRRLLSRSTFLVIRQTNRKFFFRPSAGWRPCAHHQDGCQRCAMIFGVAQFFNTLSFATTYGAHIRTFILLYECRIPAVISLPSQRWYPWESSLSQIATRFSSRH